MDDIAQRKPFDQAGFAIMQQGEGLYECVVDDGTRIRKGNTEYEFDDLDTGWRVHVKGTQTGFEGDVCGVEASEVKVQQMS